MGGSGLESRVKPSVDTAHRNHQSPELSGDQVASEPAGFMAVAGVHSRIAGGRLPTASWRRYGKERKGEEKDHASAVLDMKYSSP